MSAMSRLSSRLCASVKAHKWIWAGCAVVVIAASATAVVYYGGFFGPSGHAICKVAVLRARDYGALPSNARQDGSAKSTDVSGRKNCDVDADGEKYTVLADLKCNDLKNADCLPIYAVERSDGMSLYQVRSVPNDDDGASALADGSAGAGSGATDAGTTASPVATGTPAPQQGGEATIDADVEVARPAAAGASAPAGGAPQQ